MCSEAYSYIYIGRPWSGKTKIHFFESLLESFCGVTASWVTSGHVCARSDKLVRERKQFTKHVNKIRAPMNWNGFLVCARRWGLRNMVVGKREKLQPAHTRGDGRASNLDGNG